MQDLGCPGGGRIDDRGMEAEVQAMKRSNRKVRPSMEGLEGRQLLSASKGDAVHAQAISGASFTKTKIDYTTADGAKVHIQISTSNPDGSHGSLAGSSLDANGNLNLVYSGTTVFNSIIGTVKGGSGVAPLASIRNANVPLDSLTGLGGELLGRVLLPSFNLISGGNVNLTSGVQVFSLNSVSPNSQVHLRDTPLNTSLGLPSQGYVDTVTGRGLKFAKLSSTSTGATSGSASGLSSGTSIGVASGSAASGLTVVGQGTLNPVAIGFGGGSVGSINGPIPIINTVGNGQNFLGTPGLSQTQVSQGVVVNYITDAGSGTQLSTIGGTFAPGANLIEPTDFSLPHRVVPPPGVVLTINHVIGGPTPNTPPLGDAQIYGYDAVANALIRFDAVNGAQLQSIPLPASTSASGVGGITLARNGSEELVLVGTGTEVLAFDAVTGMGVGFFSTVATVSGIGTGGQTTVLVTAATPSNPDGTAQAIDLSQSLANHQAVSTGSPYSPSRQFSLAGTITGVPGTGNLFALGSAFLDTTQPNIKQAGILTINPGLATPTTLSESARTVLTSTAGVSLPAGTNNGVNGDSSLALGSRDSFLALDTGVVNGLNVVNLLSPNGLTKEGSFTLADANPLADLSQSFHPELANSALVDVQGNVQSFTAQNATGMVLNVAGNVDLLQINNASNSTVIGLPFSHVNIPIRNNVVITTNSRLVGTRGGVTVNSAAKQVGPLFLPSA
jgi:hypothetical protein